MNRGLSIRIPHTHSHMHIRTHPLCVYGGQQTFSINEHLVHNTGFAEYIGLCYLSFKENCENHSLLVGHSFLELFSDNTQEGNCLSSMTGTAFWHEWELFSGRSGRLVLPHTHGVGALPACIVHITAGCHPSFHVLLYRRRSYNLPHPVPGVRLPSCEREHSVLTSSSLIK